MDINKDSVVTEVLCPLADRVISDIDCIENRDIIDGFFKMECLPEEFKAKSDFKEICRKCKWHNY